MAGAEDGEDGGRDRARALAVGVRPLTGMRAGAVARPFLRDAAGSTAIEYALIGGLVFLVVVGGIRLYASKTDALYGQISSAITRIE